jgi:hypothetical protein
LNGDSNAGYPANIPHRIERGACAKVRARRGWMHSPTGAACTAESGSECCVLPGPARSPRIVGAGGNTPVGRWTHQRGCGCPTRTKRATANPRDEVLARGRSEQIGLRLHELRGCDALKRLIRVDECLGCSLGWLPRRPRPRSGRQGRPSPLRDTS